MRELKTIIIALVAMSGIAFSISIGAAPGYYNFGLIRPGNKYIGNIYLMTTSPYDIYVSLGYRPPQSAFMASARNGYKLENASEESIDDWFSFPIKKILLIPSEKTLIQLPDGSYTYINKKATFYLNVPRNAEPGYHMGTIDLIPSLPKGTNAPAVGTIGVTRAIVVFQIPGKAIRKADIVAMDAEREGENNAKIGILVKNTGTVTESVYLSEVKIFDEMNNVAAVLKSGAVKLKPGQSKVLSVYWYKKGLKTGKYKVKATVDWITGSQTKVGSVEVPKEIVKKNVIQQPPSKFPWWLIILIVLVIMLIIYWRW